MRLATFCSGIGSPEVAAESLGWESVYASEIESFPSAVLAVRHPNTINLGDMTKIHGGDLESVDVICAGTPCQSFSVAGLRKGMDDPRGNLALVLLGIVDKARPRWVVWENVPGVLSSNKGRDFGSFIGALGQLGYGFAYRIIDAQYARVDGHERAVPQRRRRVFVVGYLGDWRRAAAVLFDRESLSGNTPPRRESGQGIARDVAGSIRSGGAGTSRTGDTRGQDNVVAQSLCSRHDGSPDGAGRGFQVVAATLNAAFGEKLGLDNQHIDSGGGILSFPQVAWTLQERDHKGSDSDTKDGHLIPVQGGFFSSAMFDLTQITSKTNRTIVDPENPSSTLLKNSNPHIAFSCKDYAADAGEISPTLRSMGHDGSHANAGGQVAIAFTQNQAGDLLTGDISCSVGTSSNASGRSTPKVCGSGVRRLTPTECERLMGFPDGYTAITYRNKPACDGPRYKALGNSMAVNCMKWIFTRIQMVEEITE